MPVTYLGDYNDSPRLKRGGPDELSARCGSTTLKKKQNPAVGNSWVSEGLESPVRSGLAGRVGGVLETRFWRAVGKGLLAMSFRRL